KEIWSQMKDFAKYAFNKSHAAAYSVVTYQTAFLKAYYEPEFLTAFLNNRITNIKDVKQYTSYAKEEGIEVLPPDVNESKTYFSVKDGKIRFGLAAIKNTGVGIINEIVNERESNGKFKDFPDFIMRCIKYGINKRTIESLIYAGAFDCFKIERAKLIEVYSEIVDRAAEKEKLAGSAQISMFGTLLGDEEVFSVSYPNIPEFDSKFKLLKEKEVLGIYLSGHPLADYREAFANYEFSTKKLLDYEEIIPDDAVAEEGEEIETIKVYNDLKEGDRVRFGGIITATDRILTRSGTYMGFITVEDLYGSIECTIFPKLYTEIKDYAVLDEVVEISGRIHIKDGEASVNADSVRLIGEVKATEETKQPSGEKLAVIINDGVDVEHVRDILEAYPGDIPVLFAINGKAFNPKVSIRKCEGLNSELGGAVGKENIVFFIKNS
ncbi:MAG: OB-fold nucleic acid binding domain-containing protein, partial [Clostridia bacterium]|nr:OB-fold nucleic acid binding domain-containing protein [Clostridia bacterium]